MKVKNVIESEYNIVFSQLEGLEAYIKPSAKIMLIIDGNVNALWGKKIREAFPRREICCHVIDGEKSKSIDSAKQIIYHMAEKGFSREDIVIAAGGGVAGDITGFVAMVYMRGIDFVYLPTTLLSMSDACIGGKNGVNFEFKNYIGGFYNPKLVFIDKDFLITLPKNHFNSGFSEIIKTALLFDIEMVKEIEAKSFVLEDLIASSLKWKITVVEKDYLDKGVRRVLNYGHTFGHAIESAANHTITHGEAVATGISLENKLAVSQGIMDEALMRRIDRLLDDYGFNRRIDKADLSAMLYFAVHDKKNFNDKISFVLLNDIGAPKLYRFDKKDVEDFLSSVCR